MTLAKARELAVLSLLRAHPAHGYDMSRALASGPMAMLGLSRPAVYAILDRFLDRGWVAGETRPSGNRPDKTVMSLTDAGRDALDTLLAETSTLPQPVVPLMALFLAIDAGHPPEADRLAALLEDRRATLASLEADTDHAEAATMRLAKRLLSAEIASLEELL